MSRDECKYRWLNFVGASIDEHGKPHNYLWKCSNSLMQTDIYLIFANALGNMYRRAG